MITVNENVANNKDIVKTYTYLRRKSLKINTMHIVKKTNKEVQALK